MKRGAEYGGDRQCVTDARLRDHACRTAETEAHNPGTEDSALLDMHLLKCAHAVIITSTSSFGWAAAGMGGLRAFYVAEHGEPAAGGAPYALALEQASSKQPAARQREPSFHALLCAADKNHPSSTSAHPAFWRATSSEPCNSLGWW